MHYTQAVIAETLRLANILIMNVFHRTTRDVQVGDFTIPKDTCIGTGVLKASIKWLFAVPQISTVLYDDKVLA